MYEEDRQTAKAAEQFEHIIEVQKRTVGEEDPDLQELQRSLAQKYQRLGQTEKAVELLEYVITVHFQERRAIIIALEDIGSGIALNC